MTCHRARWWRAAAIVGGFLCLAPLPTPARALSEAEAAALRAACLTAEGCVAMTRRLLSALRSAAGGSAELTNEGIGTLAALLIDTARTDPGRRAGVAQALAELSAASTEPRQRAAIAGLAERIADPAFALETLDTVTPVAASPS